jgi:hypothetical protein
MSLKKQYELIISSLLMMLSENSPLIRSRVLKSLSSLTKEDSNLIVVDEFRKAVVERFNDMAISVREEAVKVNIY